MATDWGQYLRSYHQQHAGITEGLLTRAADSRGSSPYDRLMSQLPARPMRILDLACGSGPLSALARPGSQYIGVDRSETELRTAQSRHPGLPLVLADALFLPLADESVDAVVCSMALMLLQPLPSAVAEIARILRPGGRLVAMYPSIGLPRARQLPTVLAILAALRTTPQFPQNLTRHALTRAMNASGMRLAKHLAARYEVPVETPAQADQVINGLYLPGIQLDRLRRARRALAERARPGSTLSLHIAHVVAIKDR